MSNRFWLVWNENGRSPTHKHGTRQSAKAEAERLARQVRGERFVVLQAMEVCCVTEVHWMALTDDEVPF